MITKKILTFATCGLLISSIAFTGCNKKDSVEKAENIENVKVIAIDTNNMDKNVNPGDNFFLYSNGGWMKATPIPPEQSRWGSFNILQEETNTNLHELVEEAAKSSATKGTAKQQIGDFFKSGMDTATINKKKFQPIEADLKLVSEIKNKEEWIDKFYYLQAKTITPLFYLYSGQDDKNSAMVIAQIAQGGLGMGNRDYYFEKDKRSEELRTKYVKHIENMFKLIGTEKPDVAAKGVMEFETKLAKISMTNVEQRDPFKVYNKMSIADLQKLSPVINWEKFITNLGINTPKEINVTSVPFFKGLSGVINSTDLTILKNYFTWNILNESASLLSSDFVNEHFEFYGKTFSGKQKIDERWKTTLNMVSGQLGEPLGQIYVEKYFPPEAKVRMQNLIENVRLALGERIKKLDWMSEETKVKALEKLAAIAVKVGYPDKWEDFTKLEITPDNYYQNCINAGIFRNKKMLAEIDKPYDKTKWHMSPQTVNAYYSPNSNEIVFPAGILQPPFFYKDADDAVNYGAIGVVIAHEITHGFDDQGKNYDKIGNLVEWWTKEDSKRFNAKTKAYGIHFGKYGYPNLGKDVFINPELTMGENIADLGGVTISYDAFQYAIKANQPKEEKIDGFTPAQRFFLAYSQVWRQNIRDEELARRLKDDVHSPGDARVNAVLPHVQAFYDAFSIKEGDKMYLPPSERVIIW